MTLGDTGLSTRVAGNFSRRPGNIFCPGEHAHRNLVVRGLSTRVAGFLGNFSGARPLERNHARAWGATGMRGSLLGDHFLYPLPGRG